MPLYEYECLKCRKNLEQAVKQLGKKITKKTVSDLVGKYSNIHHIGVIDLENESVIAENGKRLPGSVDLDFYLNDGSIMILINMDKFRFSELIYEKADEKKVKCYCGESRKVEKVVSTFAFTSDLSTDMPKPDLSNLPESARRRTMLGDYIEEKDRPKKNR